MKLVIKAFLIFLLFILPISNSNAQHTTTIKGEIFGQQVDSLFLFKSTQSTRSQPLIIPVVNNQFSYTFESQFIEAYELIFPDQLKAGSWENFYKFFSETAEILIEMHPREPTGYKLSGGNLSSSYRHFINSIGISTQTKIDSLYSEIDILIENGKTEESPEVITNEDLIMKQVKYYQSKLWEYVQSEINQASYFQFYQTVVNPEAYQVSTNELIDEFVRYKTAFPNHPYTKIIGHKLTALTSIKKGGKYIDFTLPDLNGKELLLSTLVDGKITLLNFWASWCGPCIKKSREMVPILEKFEKDGFQIVGVAREFEDNTKLINAQEREQFPWINLVEIDDAHNIWAKYNMPMAAGGMILVDESGVIVEIDPTPEKIEEYLVEHLE